ncbi:hypothetical protein SESBI_20519 [Sesbania bispinosa]|nr:hypothetical protein SESBI_20519 [Sesbania bispinosa]
MASPEGPYSAKPPIIIQTFITFQVNITCTQINIQKPKSGKERKERRLLAFPRRGSAAPVHHCEPLLTAPSVTAPSVPPSPGHAGMAAVQTPLSPQAQHRPPLNQRERKNHREEEGRRCHSAAPLAAATPPHPPPSSVCHRFIAFRLQLSFLCTESSPPRTRSRATAHASPSTSHRRGTYAASFLILAAMRLLFSMCSHPPLCLSQTLTPMKP